MAVGRFEVHLVNLDPTVGHEIKKTRPCVIVSPDGYVLINSSHTIDELGVTDAVQNLPGGHIVTIPATDLALKHLRRPTPNTVLLGALAAMHEFLDIDAVERAIREKWPGKVGGINVNAARAAYTAATDGRREKACA